MASAFRSGRCSFDARWPGFACGLGGRRCTKSDWRTDGARTSWHCNPGGGFVCIEVKSGLRDYLTDGKWTEYQPFCDQFFFAVDCDFPRDILPPETGLIVCADRKADLLREPLCIRLPPARRKALLERFAWLAAGRLAALEDPMGVSDLTMALNED